MTFKSDQHRGWRDILFPQDVKKRMQVFPVAFLTIGAAIGMVLMVLLFYYFEETIKSWSGFSRYAFGLLGVYLGIAWFIHRQYRRTLDKVLED